MSAEESFNTGKYKDLIEIIAKVEFQKYAKYHIIEIEELVNIGNHAIYLLHKDKTDDEELFNSTYLSTAVKWAIRNEIRRRLRWYSLKNKADTLAAGADFDSQIELRAEIYKNVLSIEDLQDADVPVQIKSEDKTPEEKIEFIELKAGILDAMRKLTPKERELVEYKFFKDKKLREISEEFDISPSRISRIVQTALDKIKRELIKEGII